MGQKHFEYKIDRCKANIEVFDVLSKWDDEGFELVSVVYIPEEKAYKLFFKREAPVWEG